MKDLSLDKINHLAPYYVEASPREGFFEFFSTHDVHYSLFFMDDKRIMMPNDEAYHLIIDNVNHKKSPRDSKVRDTVIQIVDEFFSANNATLLYSCETGDNKQAQRSRLFKQWFATYRRKDFYTSMTSPVIDADGLLNFATIILRNDNPRLLQIINEFTDTVQLFSKKPTTTDRLQTNIIF